MVLRITESEDQPQDAGLLRDIVLVLLKNPGMEPVYLEIQTPDGLVLMEMRMINTNYSTELTKELQQILGPDTRIPGGRRGPGVQNPQPRSPDWGGPPSKTGQEKYTYNERQNNPQPCSESLEPGFPHRQRELHSWTQVKFSELPF